MKPLSTRAKRSFVLAECIKRRGDGLAEVAKLAAELADIAVGGPGKHAGGRRILRAGSQPRVQVADLCFQRGHTRFEALGFHTR